MNAVVRVGDGRGFVVRHAGERLVLTAAHCLPLDADGNLVMAAHPWSDWARTYQKLLGPLGAEPTVWAECLFVNPVADIVILGCPDNQELSDEADAYEALVGRYKPLPIADAPKMGMSLSSFRTIPTPGRGTRASSRSPASGSIARSCAAASSLVSKTRDWSRVACPDRRSSTRPAAPSP